jgi:predicted DCC family thiol-disulfide oxidoreductase YuxK
MNVAPFHVSLSAMSGHDIDRVFYDGHCGLCHGTVRFLLRRDAAGVFRFAPLQGPTFAETVPADVRAALPDSLVVVRADGELLLRSTATVHMLRRLGGGWRALGAAFGLVPAVLRDALYDLVARVRLRVFGTKDDTCPLVPRELAQRFDP